MIGLVNAVCCQVRKDSGAEKERRGGVKQKLMFICGSHQNMDEAALV